ncbi:purine-nucleoside phosphorylase [Muricauda sp. HICW]|uniref:Uridine phosphorylase n=1 Tax=Flagellimonas chongwuensis TaxID=2697365 RepID=A0A850NM11_9FLAO|nr:purine-nucleoside phosphorylase [Allomuricauda chongwuensis]NVN19602.1 purine-nucleoside phosphorylase [Allomuricauda chongwuensis]
MSTHIEAKQGEIAATVLMPGDPLRAKWIAETFLEDAFCYNKIRGMLGYTGTYKGQRISVQGSGMGMPSAMIYFHELIQDYEVKNIIRVGSAGSYQENVKINDVVLAMAASTTSGINNSKFINSDYSPTANFELFIKAVNYAQEHKIPIKAGNVLSSDEFYVDDPEEYKLWAQYGVLCVEMETAGLYTIAAKYNIKALSILTISDSLVTKERLSAHARESSFKDMVKIALAAALP